MTRSHTTSAAPRSAGARAIKSARLLAVSAWIAASACDSGPSEAAFTPLGQEGAGTNAPVNPAGTGAAAPTGGMGADIGAQAGTSAGTASPPAARTDAAVQADPTDAGPGADGAVVEAPDAGPVVEPGPIDYGARGPYEVVIEKNVGDNGFRNDVDDDTAFCNSFIGRVGGNNPDIDDQLTSYPADMDRELYTLFRPAQFEEGKTYPVLTWGNGTCSHPFHFTELIEHVVSHGFIVIATNSRQTAGGVEMLHGIDFILAENDNASSALYGKVDTDALGAFGHSQGSGATVSAGADARIAASVPIQGASGTGVARLKGPTFLIAGEEDTLVSPSSVESAFNSATVPAVYGLSLGQDHLMPGVNPTPILDAVTGWFKIHLAGDEEARELFYGADCKLCDDPRWQIKQKNL